MTWSEVPAPAPAELGARDWLRAARRAVPMAVLVAGGLALTLALRPVERAVHGARRPWTPHVTRAVCRGALRLMGLGREVAGKPSRDAAAWVSNHVSWLDIFALNANGCVTFLSKAEVARWPGIGLLARATGTLFVTRDPRRAAQDVAAVRDRIALGQTLVFFPEGTSTDGAQVLAFKPTLFAPFAGQALTVQPVTLRYEVPGGASDRVYGWWGDMAFGPHLLRTLALKRHGRVTTIFHPAVAMQDSPDRKTVARALEAQVRAGLAPSGEERVKL
ncbi:1-acyl-sn-glycerol-3-phosphate acyltransferase [Salipiger sp. IMCC34102]|uniref:lysophospholipid acyltransferase family protein n=1 Tax=Salipiger sp. IMCC34102 TaxID=2510647 RepID=UPI001F5C5A4A|nr:1-acyl-sn-glycerol-3-phosphate acyltransferase [Salipiger sp. IMCC34102]